MRNIILLMALIAFLLSSCDNMRSSKTFSNKPKKEACIEPHNPYNDGGGHDAGFNWAHENGGACDGHSDSFNEGCENYYSQLNRYNECIANSRN